MQDTIHALIWAVTSILVILALIAGVFNVGEGIMEIVFPIIAIIIGLTLVSVLYGMSRFKLSPDEEF